MGRPGFAGTAAAVAALMLGAAGCEGDPEPQFAPPSGVSSPSGSASESAGQSASQSATPEPLDREETVRAWVEARNAALQDGDTTAMSELTAAACQGCAPFAENIKTIYRAGGFIDTAGWTVLGAFRSDAAIDLRVRTARGRTVTSEGEDPIHFRAEVTELRFNLQRGSGRWLIDNVAVFTG